MSLSLEAERLKAHFAKQNAQDVETNRRLQDENRKMNATLVADAIELFKLRAALEDLIVAVRNGTHQTYLLAVADESEKALAKMAGNQ